MEVRTLYLGRAVLHHRPHHAHPEVGSSSTGRYVRTGEKSAHHCPSQVIEVVNYATCRIASMLLIILKRSSCNNGYFKIMILTFNQKELNSVLL